MLDICYNINLNLSYLVKDEDTLLVQQSYETDFESYCTAYYYLRIKYET